jgi:uncharacterized protein (UPF0335 family)
MTALKTKAREELKSYIERIERIVEEMQSLKDDQRSMFADAKAKGFDPKAMRRIIKRRQKKQVDLDEQETIDHIYMHALGMAIEAPLHAQIAALARDGLARDQVIETLQLLIPINGEIIASVGGAPMRLWRSEDGQSFAAEYVPPKAAPAEKAGGGPKPTGDVLRLVPKDHVKAAADAAEKRARAKRGEDEPNPTPAGADADQDEPVT